MTPDRAREILELAERHCDGRATPDETRRLNDALRDDAEAQRLYLTVSTLHARLLWEFGGAPEAVSPAAAMAAEDDVGDDERATPEPATPVALRDASSEIVSERSRVTSRNVSRRRIAWLAAVATLAVAALVALFVRSRGDSAPSAPVATLERVVAAEWAPGLAPLARALSPGRLSLQSGLAQIEFADGAIAILRGPAELELIDGGHAFLHHGQVRVRVGRDGRGVGFRVDTPTSRLVDLGTEFGVEVADDGGSLLQVYEGEVLASTKDARGAAAPRRVIEDQAVRLDDAVRDAPFWPERFAPLLPDPSDPAGRGVMPYNASRRDSIHVVAAKRPPAIDGDLSDWDLAHRFRAECEPPYGANYYVEGVLMHDDERLYVGAHVGDPHPMRSRMTPDESPDRHGKGGCVALRVSTDRRAGWPLRAESESARRGRPASPDDLSDRLSFVVLWYSLPTEKACVTLRHGMDLHGLRVNPPGYEGAFRMDADGRGYTLEYSLPWELLHAKDDPPRAGDELAAMWLTHWSDAEGRAWRGQLIEVMKPNESGWNFERAATWGKAIYLPPTDDARSRPATEERR